MAGSTKALTHDGSAARRVLRVLVSSWLVTLAVLVLSVLDTRLPAAPIEQGAQQNLRDTRPFKSGVEIISITATVHDGEGHLVKDLPREAFEVFEDGERQV